MPSKPTAAPDSTAVRVALWRAMHVEVDPQPHVFEDTIGLKLAAPDEGWRRRGDMHPEGTRLFRGSIVARARFVDDLVVEQFDRGVRQYVILGAGLDTFAQRRPEIASHMRIFEVDRPGAQEWKKRRLIELGFGTPEWLHFVPVDFENEDWWERLLEARFDVRHPALVASLGVSMYLTRDAVMATLRQLATLAQGSTLVMSFMLPVELTDPEERPMYEGALRGAQASGTPFISFFAPEEISALARQAGFKSVRHVSPSDVYFGRGRGGLQASNAEQVIVATT